MELSKLRILYIDGIERSVSKDGMVTKDKKWPYMLIDYPAKGYYELCKEDEPLTVLRPGEGCYILAPNIRNTCYHRSDPGETEMIPRWMQFSVTYDDVLRGCDALLAFLR